MKLRSSDNICRKRKKYISRRYSQIENADGRRKRNLRKSARNKSALICEKEKDGFTQIVAD
jgi:hypothetical protein